MLTYIFFRIPSQNGTWIITDNQTIEAPPVTGNYYNLSNLRFSEMLLFEFE